MNKASDNFWIAYPAGFYRLACWLLPAPFRREYSQEMELVFRDCCLEAYRAHGWLGALSETVRGTFDLAINALKESAGSFFNDTDRHYSFLVVSLLAFCGGVFIANSSGIEGSPDPLFLAYLFGFSLGCSRPKGFWLPGLMIGAMISFVDLGFFAAIAGSISGAIFRQALNYGTRRFA